MYSPGAGVALPLPNSSTVLRYVVANGKNRSDFVGGQCISIIIIFFPTYSG